MASRRIRFDLGFDGGAWPGVLANGRTAAFGEAWLGALGFLGALETIAGLGGRVESDAMRAAGLVARLGERDGFWRCSFEQDGLTTAMRLLRDRDALVMCGWNGEAASERLGELWAASAGAMPGVADRLREVALWLGARSGGLDGLHVTLHQQVQALPAAWRRVLDGIVRCGGQVDFEEEVHAAGANSDLACARARAATFSPTGDGTLQLCRAYGPLDAADDVAAWLAALPSLDSTVIVGGDEVLDAALARHGLPTVGAGSDEGSVLAVLPLCIEAGWSPADPAKLHELLTVDPSPIAGAVGRRLLFALQKWPAADSDLWRQGLADGLATLEGDRRATAEMRVAMIFSPAADRNEGRYPRAALLRRIDCVTGWAQGKLSGPDAAHFHGVLAQCATLQEVLEAATEDSFSRPELRRWLDVARGAAPVGKTAEAQVGLVRVRQPEGLVGPAKRVVWWDFTRRSAKKPRPLRLTPIERTQLAAAGVEIPDTGTETSALARRWARPLMMASESLLLVCPRRDRTGEASTPHPLWDEIAVRATAGAERLQHARPTGEHAPKRTKVKLRPLPGPRLTWKASRLLPPREHESPSSLFSLLGCSLKWALTYHAKLHTGATAQPPGPAPLLYGSLAHEIMHHVLLASPATAEEAAALAGKMFDSDGPRLAAPLFLPRYRAESASTRHAICESARVLTQAILDSGATVRMVEERQFLQSAVLPLAGTPDLVLENPNVVIDHKWGKTGRIKELQQGTALQLRVYARLCAKGDDVPGVGYMFLNSQELVVEKGCGLASARQVVCVPEEETWEGAARAMTRRRAELDDGVVCAPGADGSDTDDQLLAGQLQLAPPCTYCHFQALCGRAFAS